jgi:putative chitinase
MSMQNNFMGLNGFVWFMGIVESRDDPLKLGRVQARLFGWHTDNKNDIPTGDLPWAQPMFPPNSSTLTSTPKEGDMIVGFFTDGESAQFPIFLGVLPGIPESTPPDSLGFSDPRTQAQRSGAPSKPFSRILYNNGVYMKSDDKDRYPRKRHLNQPTTSRLARNEDTANTVYQFRKTNWVQVESTNGSKWKEPYPAYNAQYPFNTVLETESGHIFEMDDTTSNERIMLTHRTGTTSEMYPSGSKLEKVVKDNYTIVHGSDFCYIKGKAEITVENVAKIRIKGKTTIEIDGDVDFKVAGDMNLSVGKSFNIEAASMSTNIAGKSSINVGSKDETISGETHHRYDGDLHTFIGADTYDRHNPGKDYSCPADPSRTSDSDCSAVNSAKVENLKEPNKYNNPDEVVTLPEQVRIINYSPNVSPNAPLPANVALTTVITVPTEPEVTETPPAANVSSGTCFTLPMLNATSSRGAKNLQIYVDTFNKACETYLLNTVLRKTHFLAQCSHESGGFAIVEENLNYSAEGLRRTFPKYFPDDATAQAYARQPEKIANKVYANRMNNGNEASGDGWKYHGRGLIQLTGKDNYTRFANAMKMSLDDVVAYCQTPEGAAMSAVWFWNSRGINAQADSDNIEAVTRKVNGGLIGLDDRKSKYSKTLPVVQKESS